MAKTPGKKNVSKAEQAAAAAEAAVEQAAATSKSRGPRGVAETAVITNVVANPKREGSKAQRVFAHYREGMTIAEFCESLKSEGLEKEATPNLVYDAKHGFIQIEGYNPGEIIQPKPKKEPKAKAPKKAKSAEEVAAVAEADAVATEESLD